jgi:hypothetical protein
MIHMMNNIRNMRIKIERKGKKLQVLLEQLIWRFSDAGDGGLIQADLLMARAELLRFLKDSNPETGLRNLILEVCEVFHAFLVEGRLSVPDLWVIQDSLKLLLTWSQGENQIEQNQTPGILDEKAKEFFIAWFRNKMTIVFMRLESEMPIPEASRQKILFFLDEMEHHFKFVALEEDPFNWLKDFFKAYPEVSAEERLKALHFSQGIYEAYGLRLPHGIVKRLQNKWVKKGDSDENEKKSSRQ